MYLKTERNFTYYTLGSQNHPNPETIVGIRTPPGIERRDLQAQLNRRLCNNCLSRPQCKVQHRCEYCGKWCNPDEIESVATEKPSTTTTQSEISTTSTTADPWVVDTTHQEIADEPTVGIANRFGESRSSDSKHLHTLATLRSGKLKEIICKLLGVKDISDIASMIIWVTTHSDKPPQFLPEHKKQVSPEAEETFDRLNKALDRALQNKKRKGDGKYLTNHEIMQVIEMVSIDAKNHMKQTGRARSSWSEELLPLYPIEPNSMGDDISRVLNPGVIEDTPDMSLLGKEQEQNVPTRIGETGTTSGEGSDINALPKNKEKGTTAAPEKTESESEEDKSDSSIEKSTEKSVTQADVKKPPIVYPLYREVPDTQLEDEQQEDNRLGHAEINKKIKQKIVEKEQRRPPYFPQNYRANEIREDGIVGKTENEQKVLKSFFRGGPKL